MISNLHKQRFQKKIPLVEGALFPIFFIFVFFGIQLGDYYMETVIMVINFTMHVTLQFYLL